MDQVDLKTSAKNTWCPGCGNFAILNALKVVLKQLHEEDTGLENVVLVSGIGCHAKIVDYVKVNSFYSLHGRVVPVAEGIKLARPGVKVIGFSGDGDSYGEGLAHLMFAAKRNIDITMIIHNNRVYGLTTGQYTPTSPLGFKGKSTPKGTLESPLNPLEVMLSCKAGFIARAYTHGIELLKSILREAVRHKGFSLVDVLQVCVTFNNMYEYYTKKVYELKDHDPENFDTALAKIREWDYNNDAPIALGTFYKKESPTLDQKITLPNQSISDRDSKIREVLNKM
ncbi:MAG: 2-oxoacid:ferredoxin oxidoreductase subunit beta [Candidatus Omnitrophica bacterium]|nr:2-oxoacid:ferredoxin oxidoreductase subunit beta [Candidatus Omnitrophota bacterium]